MNQGYEPQDVTILATYSGQMFYMRKVSTYYKYVHAIFSKSDDLFADKCEENESFP